MPQPSAQGQAVAAAGGATVVVPAAAGSAAAAASVGGTVALGAATAAVVTGLVAFLGALRQRQQVWLVAQLGRYSSHVDDIRQVAAQEQARGEEFARRSAERVASAMPQALAIADQAQRVARVRQIMADEERYARQRSEAMMARAIAAVSRMSLKRESPLGAYWELGHAQQHTEGCKFMHGKFWPWAVLDRVYPPRHYGCTSRLRSFGDAVHAGLMSAGDVPDTRDAIRAAAGVMMEEEEAIALERELELREQMVASGADPVALAQMPWLGLLEAFDPAEPRDARGRWRRTAAALVRGELAEIAPADIGKLVDELAKSDVSSLHRLQVTGHRNLFRVNARDLPRAQMPQIPKAHLPGFMDFLRSKRVMATVERTAPSKLRATQNQINGGAVARMSKSWDPTRNGLMMVSREGDVLDGHHRWATAALHELQHPGSEIDTLRFSASTDRMLALMHEYNRQVGVPRRAFGEGPSATGGKSWRAA